MPRKDANTGQISAKAQQDLVSEGIENFELPKTIVAKIAKSAVRGVASLCFRGAERLLVTRRFSVDSQLPESAKLQKETVLSLVKGSTVFINYLGASNGRFVRAVGLM